MSAEKSIKIIPFDGTEEGYEMWSCKFKAYCIEKDCDTALLPRTSPEDALTGDDITKNQKAYNLMLLSVDDKKSFNIIKNAKRTNVPNDAALAWKNLKDEFEPKEETDKTTLTQEFFTAECDSDQEPHQWIVDMEIMRARLEEMNEHISDSLFISTILNGLPKEYDTTVDLLNMQGSRTVAKVKAELKQKYKQ